MLWADELLEAQRQIQADLAESAQLFNRHRRRILIEPRSVGTNGDVTGDEFLAFFGSRRRRSDGRWREERGEVEGLECPHLFLL
jgi:hypothetical protein